MWIFNWVCWLNQCCCCDFLHNPVNKRIAWWISFSFLLGVLACCISAFVNVNRFGFALNGAACAFDRIYYDVLYGQLKAKEEKWEGLKNTTDSLDVIQDFCDHITDEKKLCQLIDFSIITKLINERIPKPETFEKNIKDRIKFDDFHKWHKTLYASLMVLSMIYFCLLLIVVAAAGISMMFYACLKRQGYLITFMHILWNAIRFFIFWFFLFGTEYGIMFLILKDLIFCMKNFLKTFKKWNI